jgi:hypothetical protein
VITRDAQRPGLREGVVVLPDPLARIAVRIVLPDVETRRFV